MSSSSKEREILERQRKLAEQMKGKSEVKALPKVIPKKTRIDLTTGATKALPPRKVVVDLTSEQKPTKKPPPPPPVRPTIKRPTKRPRLTSSATTRKPEPPPKLKPSPKITRKTVTNNNKTSDFSQLLKHVASAEATPAAPSINPLTPDDFWKHLREWDFCREYWQEEEEEPLQTKPLPEVFGSARHYMMAWSPLLLAECRAQLLQEFRSSKQRRLGIPVHVETTTHAMSRSRDLRDNPWEELETGVYVKLRTKYREKCQFFTNDIAVLVVKESADIFDTDDENATVEGISLVGHCEATYDTVEGMTLKVSKRRWATIGQKEMVLFRVGSNVTALREFTALCRIEQLPLKQFLLGEHLAKEENRRKLSRNQSPEVLLERMGGSQLGEGFQQFCRRKFNQSQLTAIAASAHEYGEGGFTLIKGPPGTGSMSLGYTTLLPVSNVRLTACIRDDDVDDGPQLAAHSSVQQVLRGSEENCNEPWRCWTERVAGGASLETSSPRVRSFQRCRG